MMIKIFGCLAVLLGSYGIGYMLIHQEIRKEKALEELHHCLQWMICELRYEMPPLEALCRGAAEQRQGSIAGVMLKLSDLLRKQQGLNPALCMQAAIGSVGNLPKQAAVRLQELGHSLGQFDLENQIASISLTAQHCSQDLEQTRNGMDIRRRNYQTLSLCAGVAVVILLL